ncbi:MAG: hypothetical protein ABEJ68_04155 [Halobacteriaceae archaeon]
MATKRTEFDEMAERCENCARDTPHSVSIELKTESATTENAEFSREPYRVSECDVCGERSVQRMNNA